MSEEKNTESKVTSKRKVAPNIQVGFFSGRDAVSKLEKEHPEKSFLCVPSDTSDEALANEGRRIVRDKLGNPLMSGSRVIVEELTDDRIKFIAAEHAAATERVAQVRDTSSSYSKDATSIRKDHVM